MKKPLRNVVLFLSSLILHAASAYCEDPIKSINFAGQWPYHPSNAVAIDSDRDILFLGDGDSVNILDKDLNFISSFFVTESSQIGGLFYSAKDKLLYVACRTDGLKIYDIQDAYNPLEIIAYSPDSFETVGVYIDTDKAYLSCGIDGMIILDITDVANPAFLSKTKLPGGYGLSYAADIFASGSHAFAADLYNGVHFIDISNPLKPSYQKGFAMAGACDLSVSLGYLYTVLQGNGMGIIDISIPEVKSLFLADGIETAVLVDGNLAYISYNTNGLRVLDVSDKSAPIADPSWTYNESGGSSLGMIAGENAIYMASNQLGLQKIDVQDKTNMHSLQSYDTPADAVAIYISGSYVYSVDDNVGSSPEKEGLRIHQLIPYAKTIQFSPISFCATPGTANDILVSGDYAYVADGIEGLQILSIGDKTNPMISGNYDTQGVAKGIFVDGNYAYVADGDQGVAIIDISNKAAPLLTQQISTPGFANKIHVSGSFAFVADGDKGLQIFNLLDMSNPVLSGNYDTSGNAKGIFINGNYAYIADGEEGIAVIDVSNKVSPSLITYYNTEGSAENITVHGNYAYVADGLNGLCCLDISNPLQPVAETAWSYNSPGNTIDVIGGYFTEDEESFVFIADGASGVIAINLSVNDSENPEDAGGGGGGGCFIETVRFSDLEF